MKHFRYCLFSTILFLTAIHLMAQSQPGGNRQGGQNMNMGRFYGKVVDVNTNKPVEAASVQLLQNKLDTTTKKVRKCSFHAC